MEKLIKLIKILYAKFIKIISHDVISILIMLAIFIVYTALCYLAVWSIGGK